MKKIVVAGGCFWGVEHFYKQVKGIVSTKVGYANSKKVDINYEETCSGKYEAVEAVYLSYDEDVISIDKIIELLFRIIDPTSINKQGGDIGVQYRTGIYTNDIDEKNYINNVITSYKDKYEDDIVVEVTSLDNFYNAEEYHQEYLIKNTGGYCHIDMSKLTEEDKK